MVNMMKPLAKVARQAVKIKPVARLLAKCSKNKPEIMAIGGGALVIWAFVEAIRGGMKVQAVMEETADNVEKIEEKYNDQLKHCEENDILPTVILEDKAKELTKARREGTWKVVRLFMLPSGLLVVGMVLIGGGHHILRKRNVVLGTALKGTEEVLKHYRENVVADQGEEADLKYMRGVIDGKDVETVIVDEDGKEKKVKRRVPVVKGQKGNPWRFEFSDAYFSTYEEDTDRNLFFLKCEEDWWNNELERHGEVNMYEVLKHLGYKFEVLKASCRNNEEYRERMTFLRNYGWRKGCGDGFVDFGLYRAINEAAVRRQSDIVFIEFNCAGNLENLTEKKYM